MRKIALCVSWLLLAAGLCSCSLLPAEQQPLAPPVASSASSAARSLYRVTRGDLKKTVSMNAQYMPAATQTLSFSVSGVSVASVNVSVGDSVKKGDVLASLDTSDLDSQLADIGGKLAAASDAVASCKALYAFDKNAAAVTGDGSQVSADLTQLANLEGEQQSLQLQQSLLTRQKAQRRIVAGLNGVVTDVEDVGVGDLSVKGSPVVTVADESKSVFAVADPNNTYLTAGLQVDMAVQGVTYKAKVGSPSALGVTEPQSGTVYLSLESPVVFPGGAVGTIDLLVAERDNVLIIPAGAVNTAGSTTFVYLLVNGVTTTRPVTVGLKTDSYAEIVSGLAEGDEILSGGTLG